MPSIAIDVGCIAMQSAPSRGLPLGISEGHEPMVSTPMSATYVFRMLCDVVSELSRTGIWS